MITKELIADQAQTIVRLQQECTEKTKMIEDLSTALGFTTRQYEALEKKYSEVLRLSKKAEQNYESCLKNLEEEVGRLRNEKAKAQQKACSLVG